MNRIRKILEEAEGKWVEELPSVLWAYRIISQKVTNEMPYSLAFAIKVIILLEVGLPTIQTEAYNEENTLSFSH